MSVSLNQRLSALDAFRGMTIAGMILVNNPGTWGAVYPPLEHAAWHGLTPTDLVFPFFLYIVGVSMWFSFAAYDHKPSSELLKKVFWRAVSIYVVYYLIHTWPLVKQDWDFSKYRILGVLPRIALVFFCTSILVLFLDQKKIWITAGVILLGYWVMMWLGGSGADRYSLETNFQRMVDLQWLGEGHMYKGEGIPFDPEGILSTLPSMATALIGYEVARQIAQRESWNLLLSRMLVWGAIMIAIALVWHFLFPINKKLWTSSYVLVTGGLATWFLAAWLWIVEVKGWHKLSFPFKVYGLNAIFAYFAVDIWVISAAKIKYKLNGKEVDGLSYLYKTIFEPLSSNPYNSSLYYALAVVTGMWLLLYWMYRKRLFIKL